MDVKGKTVVVTGVLAGMQRDAAEAGLTSLGARVTGSVSANTDFLVVGASAGSKLAKAEALGVATLTEAQARDALAGAAPAKKKPKKPKKKAAREAK